MWADTGTDTLYQPILMVSGIISVSAFFFKPIKKKKKMEFVHIYLLLMNVNLLNLADIDYI